MRRLTHGTAAFLTCVVVLVVLVDAKRAEACSCLAQSIPDAFAAADVVLRATVVAIHEQNGSECDVNGGDADDVDFNAPTLFELEVHEVFKGEATERSFAASTSSACPAFLRLGDERILLLSRLPSTEVPSPLAGTLGVHTCTTMLTPPSALPPNLAADAQPPAAGASPPDCFAPESCASTSAPLASGAATCLLLLFASRRRQRQVTTRTEQQGCRPTSTSTSTSGLILSAHHCGERLDAEVAPGPATITSSCAARSERSVRAS